MTDADWERFRRIARFRLRRFPQLDPMDLVQDTACRFVEMKRKWPQGEVFKAVFYNALRSVADEYRGHEMTSPHMAESELSSSTEGEANILGALLEDRRTAEIAIEARQLLDKVFAKFKEDPDVEAVLVGKMEGFSSKEVQEEFTMSSNAYDAARKRFERWLSDELKTTDRQRVR